MNTQNEMPTFSETLFKGIGGTIAAIGGAAVSMAAVNEWLQFFSLIVGICVGLLTIRSLTKKRK
jgi:hypothetical protein